MCVVVTFPYFYALYDCDNKSIDRQHEMSFFCCVLKFYLFWLNASHDQAVHSPSACIKVVFLMLHAVIWSEASFFQGELKPSAPEKNNMRG